MKLSKTLNIFLLIIPMCAFAMPTAEHINLQQYLGKWHEIARIDSWFEKGCTDSTANYSLNADNEISVVNSCYKNDGKNFEQAKGRAWVVDSTTNAKLKVSFLPKYLKFLDAVFYGDYWILKIDPDYKVVLVGDPSCKYLWVLARTPKIDDKIYAEYVDYAKSLGFDVTKLHKTILLQKGIN